MRLLLLVSLLAGGCLSAPSDLHGSEVGEDGAIGAPGDGGVASDLAGVADGGGAGSTDLAQPIVAGALTPPGGASSGGSGGGASGGVAMRTTGNGIAYRLIVPASYSDATKAPLLIVYSGTEGGATMANNLVSLAAPVPSSAGYIRAVLDGVTYNGDGAAGVNVLDELRAKYNIDNDRTYLIGESAGTTAAFALGYHLRQTYFAAYWANDVAASTADGPAQTAAQLGFAPWGQVGPGGATALAAAIAQKLALASYRTDSVTPYAGTGAGTHGSGDQFIAALSWLDGKKR